MANYTEEELIKELNKYYKNIGDLYKSDLVSPEHKTSDTKTKEVLL